MRRLARTAAWMPLVAYVAAMALGPALHERHHAVHGADHEHFAAGTVYAPAPHGHAVDEEHARFDDDLALLDLAEVAEAGTLSVDCALAAYTLAVCAPDADHAHRFGDSLIPHESPRSRRAPDPEHHRNAIEHLAAPSLLAVAPQLLVRPAVVLAPPLAFAPLAPPSLRSPRPRGRAPPVA